jgi:hypothetical protein
MTNITPEEWLKTYAGDPKTFSELMDAYSAYIDEIYSRVKQSGEDFDVNLLDGELSFDRFMMSLWKDGQKK